jgi:hypothetical protein
VSYRIISRRIQGAPWLFVVASTGRVVDLPELPALARIRDTRRPPRRYRAVLADEGQPRTAGLAPLNLHGGGFRWPAAMPLHFADTEALVGDVVDVTLAEPGALAGTIGAALVGTVAFRDSPLGDACWAAARAGLMVGLCMVVTVTALDGAGRHAAGVVDYVKLEDTSGPCLAGARLLEAIPA